jgi:ectoine hydroxylase-related dioxygenase (phytanoyl-CoA dioxygenase family)
MFFMSGVATIPELKSGGHAIDAAHIQPMRDSSSIAWDANALQERIAQDGYLYLPGILDRDHVMEARLEMTRRLAEQDHIEPGTEPIEAIAKQGTTVHFKPDLAWENKPLMSLLYSGRLMEWFARFFGEPVRHFDYTWIRAIAPGTGTPSHCDAVYMNRGTSRLFTCWTPIGDIDLAQGGLMVLEGSNNNSRLRETYCKYDVDTFCENRPEINGWKRGGHLTADPNQVSKSIGGTWRTGEYHAGDIVVFTIFTVHGSLDNQSNRIRLSSDTRYQPASEPADERWGGPAPLAHGNAGKRGRIC